MIIILRKIPSETLYQDIIEFIEPALKGKWFNKGGYIEEVKILIIKDPDKETIEQHALVRISPDSCAKRVIKLLNRKPILEKRIAVREYQYRSWRNDPRTSANKNLAEKLRRRRGSRRRPNLETIIKSPVTVSSHKSFHRIQA
jgi:hypothetical protein